MLQKEAAINPQPERQPPAIMMGRLPYLFTRMLLMGPRESKEICPEMSYLCTRDKTDARKHTGGLLPPASSFRPETLHPARELGQGERTGGAETAGDKSDIWSENRKLKLL